LAKYHPEEVIKIVTVKVSELLKMAQELSDDGIEYVDVEECESDEDFPKHLSFIGYEGFGGAIDYEEIEHIDISYDYKYEKSLKL
jgi:hypothetical protein